ncbi:hypothetical protein C4G66_RS23520 [Vibrio parahaemolyticus]|nr:hypothetical protein [Vibrio parahaemolyticus]EJG0989857.1 hypothetical protein [Vibrio parahaemolyticus]EJG1071821.1 hypothetical protein [Vibrio parahaemolyticus]HCG9740634.1 hypothetical protein [Vibrio parahaemolyticus]
MNLYEVVEKIESFDDEATIFVDTETNDISAQSEAEVIYLSDEELKEDISFVAEKRCKGKRYFLEVSIVLELNEDWASNHDGMLPTTVQLVNCCIHYARFDSYPSEFFN